MRVNLRRGQALVAEQFLHAADVGAGIEHVRRETVPQGVRAGPRIEPRVLQIFRQQAADAATS